ncbi:MAG: hypothetical protein AAFO80_05680 [Pseudomonadota bacterium]
MTATLPAMVFAGLAVMTAAFQTALAAGAPYGRWTLGGMYPGRLPAPQRAGAAVQSTLYLAMALVMAGHGGVVDWVPPGWAVWSALAITLLAAVGAVFTPSPRERRLWAPVLVAMLVAGGAVALL